MTRLAVVMAAKNADKTIQASVDSLFASPCDFDLYIVDDGSTQPIASYIKGPKGRLHVIRLETSVRQTKALNIALREVFAKNYDYVAINDGDDLSHPTRLPKEMAFLDANPAVALVGTWARCIDDAGNLLSLIEYPTTSAALQKQSYLCGSFVHSSLMMRVPVLKALGGYDETFPVAQDYELTFRISKAHGVANLPEHLVDYRISSTSTSATKERAQRVARLHIQLKHFNPAVPLAWYAVAKSAGRLMFPSALVRWGKQLIGRSLRPGRAVGPSATTQGSAS